MQFHSLTVVNVVAETEDARSFALAIPEVLRAAFRYRAGQHLTFRVNVDGEILTRSYSLSSSPEAQGLPVVTVKRVARGKVSNWFHSHVAPGSVLDVSEPTGRFVCDDGAASLVFCAAGSGITPVLSMIRSALASTHRVVTLFYANRDAGSVIFGQAIARLAAEHPQRLKVLLHYDDVHGIPDSNTLGNLLRSDTDFQLYLCGPAPFMAMVQQAACEAGVPGARVHLERFDATPTTSSVVTQDMAAGGSCDARVTTKGMQQIVRVEDGQSLLQAMLAAGLDVPYACEEGYCGSCAAKCLDGEVVHAHNDVFSADELAAGWILACQARPRRDHSLTISYDV